ncbi:MAG: gliding motility-associated ABC transporter substrate-binding protein GldG [Flavobacteriales bacterium]|nr:gliding motility-associated ABC transporter substrate-binding protein GldG [Flavobacteriales bacterium]
MSSQKSSKPTSVKSRYIMQFLVVMVAIIVANVAGDIWYQRIDLTHEKRYTLSEASENLVDKLDDVVYVQVFLDGEFPSEYRLLKNAIRDMLSEFRSISSGNLEFKFEDVLADKTIEEKENILRQLSSKGLQITRPEVDEDDAQMEKFIIPGALVIYKDQEYPLNFLKRDFGQPLEQEINESVELLEYEIGNVLRKCVADRAVKIAFTTGHGELEPIEVADIARTLEEFYIVERININITDTNSLKPFAQELFKNPERSGEIIMNGLLDGMKAYKALIIAKPRVNFLDEELFLIDQYVMNGGKVIWLAETLIADIDSVARYGSVMTADYNLNINDLLFRYGARINLDLIQDLNSHGIPVLATDGSGKPGFRPWIFYPLFAPDGEHPIVRNMTEVWGRFVSSIDTLPNKEVKKTVLLHSGQNSRVARNPVNININMVGMKMDPAMFTDPGKISAVLLEGKFRSVFSHRPAMRDQSPIEFKPEIDQNSMIVISDGDLIANQVSKDKQVYPLGYDRFASKAFNQPIEFSNKKFFLNCVDYLCDDSNLIEVRSKKVVLRLLDKVRVKTERTRWQMINMVLPVVLILLFGLLNAFIRKRRYTKA